MEFIEVVVEAYVMENEAQFPHIMVNQGLLYLDGRNSQKYLHQDQAYI